MHLLLQHPLVQPHHILLMNCSRHTDTISERSTITYKSASDPPVETHPLSIFDDSNLYQA